MPYELSFRKAFKPRDETGYLNDCCYGGDVIGELLLPDIERRFGEVQFNQEDWGWFLWFRRGAASLAVDIFCDDPGSGDYRVHLTSRARRLLFSDVVRDMPELEELRTVVLARLEAWLGGKCQVTLLDEHHVARPG